MYKTRVVTAGIIVAVCCFLPVVVIAVLLGPILGTLFVLVCIASWIGVLIMKLNHKPTQAELDKLGIKS